MNFVLPIKADKEDKDNLIFSHSIFILVNGYSSTKNNNHTKCFWRKKTKRDTHQFP